MGASVGTEHTQTANAQHKGDLLPGWMQGEGCSAPGSDGYNLQK